MVQRFIRRRIRRPSKAGTNKTRTSLSPVPFSSDDRQPLPHYNPIAPTMVTPEMIKALASEDGKYESPVDLSFDNMKSITLPKITWYNMEQHPKLMKITNSGHSAIISGKWFGPRPYVCNGPLTGTYVFAQLHFHWGPDDEQGSEHTLDGQKLPLEMHVIFFNSIYMTQDDAKNKKDGIIVFSYFFKLQAEDNENLSPIVNSLRLIRQPFKSEHLELMPLMELVYPFEDDYFLYWGNVSGKESQHPVLWLLCRHPYLISSGQLDYFRSLTDLNNEPILKNYRPVQCPYEGEIFHVNPSTERFGLLLLTAREREAKLAEIGPSGQKKVRGRGGKPTGIGAHYLLSDQFGHLKNIHPGNTDGVVNSSTDSIDDLPPEPKSSNKLDEFVKEESGKTPSYEGILDQLSRFVENCDAGDSTSLEKIQARLKDALQIIESKKSIANATVTTAEDTEKNISSQPFTCVDPITDERQSISEKLSKPDCVASERRGVVECEVDLKDTLFTLGSSKVESVSSIPETGTTELKKTRSTPQLRVRDDELPIPVFRETEPEHVKEVVEEQSVLKDIVTPTMVATEISTAEEEKGAEQGEEVSVAKSVEEVVSELVREASAKSVQSKASAKSVQSKASAKSVQSKASANQDGEVPISGEQPTEEVGDTIERKNEVSKMEVGVLENTDKTLLDLMEQHVVSRGNRAASQTKSTVELRTRPPPGAAMRPPPSTAPRAPQCPRPALSSRAPPPARAKPPPLLPNIPCPPIKTPTKIPKRAPPKKPLWRY